MTVADLTTATNPNGSIVPGDPITMTSSSPWHYFHIPAMLFDPVKHYEITISYTGGDAGANNEIWMYSQPTPDLSGYNTGQWQTLARDVALTAGVGTAVFTVGPAVEDWPAAVTAGEAYAIIEFYDDTPFDATITAISWVETAAPPPPEVIAAVSGTYIPDIIAWNRDRSYFCAWGGSNLPKFKMQIAADFRSITKGPHTEAFVTYTFVSNEVQPGVVPYRYTSAFSGANWYIRCMELDDGPLTFLDQAIYPVNPLMSGNPQVRAMAVPPRQGKIYLLSVSSTGSPNPQMWRCTVDSAGIMTAFTLLGTVSYPNPGALSGGGTNYHVVNFSDPVMISDNVGYSINTRTLWNQNNPTTFIEGYNIAGGGDGMDPAYDTCDPGMGAASASYINPGHLLLHRRANGFINSTIVNKLVDVEINDTTTAFVGRQTWTAPTGYYIAASTWAKLPGGGIGAVVAIRDSASVYRIFYDVFNNPTEYFFPAEWAGPAQVTNMAPGPGFGWTMGVGYGAFNTYFMSVQFFFDELGRLKVYDGTVWKYAVPRAGENDGFGALKLWNGESWVRPAIGQLKVHDGVSWRKA